MVSVELLSLCGNGVPRFLSIRCTFSGSLLSSECFSVHSIVFLYSELVIGFAPFMRFLAGSCDVTFACIIYRAILLYYVNIVKCKIDFSSDNIQSALKQIFFCFKADFLCLLIRYFILYYSQKLKSKKEKNSDEKRKPTHNRAL